MRSGDLRDAGNAIRDLRDPPQSAIDTCIGFLSIIIWPSIIIGGVSGIITLVAAVKAKQAHGSLGK